MVKIVQAPNNVLLTTAQPIKKIDKSIKTLIKEMVVALENAKDPEGVGLAAPQVGKSLRLFIVKEDTDSEIGVFINPEVELLSPIEREKPKNKDKGIKLEGCLSLKDIWGVVSRSPKVKITYQDEHGKQHERTVTGFLATILQHEFDHINGVLFTTRVLEQKEKLYHSTKDEKGEIVFEEIEI
jgi:peptide deformylase